mmetsp:Transcript_18091/g.33423  ORF Transcript_18091/g.33423 Transcript_18091/m.33423 type:complete len:257 (-) Transcript_18091:32-802(-)
MEDFDDLVQKPDEDGGIDLSHQAWAIVDRSVWEWKEKLVHLKLAYNNISALPPELGMVTCLRSFDVSFNKLGTIPQELGNCTRLKKLKAIGNNLEAIPASIGKCKGLQELLISENAIKELPVTIGELALLRVFHAQNNKLQTVCPELGKCLSLEDIDLSHNPDIDNVPVKCLGDTELVLWMCRHNAQHVKHMEELEENNQDLEEAAEFNEAEIAEMRYEIAALKEQNAQLLSDRPDRYLKALEVVERAKSRACTIQ